MKKEVNRALVAKKMYVSPLVEVTKVSLVSGLLNISGSGSGTPEPAPRPRGGKLW